MHIRRFAGSVQGAEIDHKSGDVPVQDAQRVSGGRIAYMRKIVLAVAAVLMTAFSAQANVCVNKFLSRPEGPRQVVTLLTGMLTFQEAQALAEAIEKRQAPPLEWLDDGGRTIARQFGGLKVVRPMPVGCNGKPSGVIVIADFATVQKPSKRMNVKLGPDTLVEFTEQ